MGTTYAIRLHPEVRMIAEKILADEPDSLSILELIHFVDTYLQSHVYIIPEEFRGKESGFYFHLLEIVWILKHQKKSV